MKAKRILSLLICAIMLVSTFTSASAITASAKTTSSATVSENDEIHTDAIVIDPSFEGSDWNIGDMVKIPFSIFSYGNVGHRFYVKIYNSCGVAVAEKSGNFPSTAGEAKFTLAWDSKGESMGVYYVRFYATYPQPTDESMCPFNLGMKNAEKMHFDNVIKSTKNAVNNNIKKPLSAWGYTKANYKRWNHEDAGAYTLRLEEMFTGEYADSIVKAENQFNDKPGDSQHWILMKFYLKNNGKKALDASDIISFNRSFYTTEGASLNILDTATFSGSRRGMSNYDLQLESGASGYFWIGILPKQNIKFPYIKINNGYNKDKHEENVSWLYSNPEEHFLTIDNKEYYFNGDKYAANYTGICKNGGSVSYYTKGKVDTTVTGLKKYRGSTYYVENGVVNTKFNSLKKIDGKFHYIKNGILYTSPTLVKYNNEWYYVNNGVVDNKNTLVKYNDKWYHVKGGKLVRDTTLVKYNDIYYYVKNGVKNTSNTLCKYNGKWYHVKGGKLVRDTTLVKYNGKWYYVKNGVLNKSNTFCKYNGKYYHVKGGLWVKDTGIVKQGSKSYVVRKGIRSTVTGVEIISGKYYFVKNGALV